MWISIKNLLARTVVLYALVLAIFIFVVNGSIIRTLRINALEFFVVNPAWQVKNLDLATWQPIIRYYKLLAASYPLLGRAQEMIGYGYFSIKDFKLSRHYYMKAALASPQRVWLTYNLGVIAYNQGEMYKAKKYFDQVANGDYQKQVEACLLSSLKSIDGVTRQKLVEILYTFVLSLRSQSMTYLLALETSHQITDKQLLQLELHPWAYVIIPCKEVFVH